MDADAKKLQKAEIKLIKHLIYISSFSIIHISDEDIFLLERRKRMIHRNFSENIKIAPRELERELWDMNTTEQADFLLAMSQRYKNRFDDSIIRYKFLKKEMDSCLTKEERDNVMNILKMLITHLESEL